MSDFLNNLLDAPSETYAARRRKCRNNRSVMPLDTPGRTRATMDTSTSSSCSVWCISVRTRRVFLKEWLIFEPCPRLGSRSAILPREQGMFRRRESSTRIDYVPALCTHRPSHLPMLLILNSWDWSCFGEIENARESRAVEEGEVVTRFP